MFDSKRSIANHYTRIHGKTTTPPRNSQEAGSFSCDYCNKLYPSKRSLAQHIRNQHAEEASDQRATQAAKWEARYWTERDHQLFLEALARYGPASNIQLAKHIGTKTSKQVGTHKRIFLRDHPDWIKNCPPPDSPQSKDSSEEAAMNPTPAVTPTQTRQGDTLTPPDCPNQTVTPSQASQDDSLLSTTSLALEVQPSQENPSSQQDLLDRADNVLMKLRQPPLASQAPSEDDTLSQTMNTSQSTASGQNHTQAKGNNTEQPPEPESEEPSASKDRDGTWNERVKEAGRRRDERMKRFMEESSSLTSRLLTDEEWSQFTNMVDILVADLNLLIETKPRRHPTTNWKKRQRRRPPTSRRPPPPSQATPPPSSETDESPPSSSQEPSLPQSQPSQQSPEAHESRRSHQRNERKRRAREASKIQRWYRANKKRCFRSISSEDKSPKCEIPLKELEDHFTVTPPPPPCSPPPDGFPETQGTYEPDELSYNVTPEEVKSQLKRLPSQSSPGPDGVPYYVWKSSPVAPELLSAVYTTCSINQRTPDSWKGSNTILIHKKGDTSCPSNWRPISLQPTVYKIYAAILAKRLATWAIDNKKISSAQKGFLPFEGCLEHSFLIESILEDSKRRRKDVRIAWLDLKNAFGSVPHHTMWSMMDALRVPSHFSNICKEIYANSTQRVRSAEGLTEEIKLAQGIKQGCPLSPLLFNLVLEGVLPHVDQMNGGYEFGDGTRLQILAYADDICVIGKSKEEINSALRKIYSFTQWAGLKFNSVKCGCLSLINHGSKKHVDNFQPTLGPDQLPSLSWGDRYKYLGVQRGRMTDRSPKELTDVMVKEAGAICNSLLTDWQKIDALNTFVLTKAQYRLDASSVNRTWCQQVDAAIRRAVKKAVKLPRNALSSFLYMSRQQGGLGLTSVEDMMDVTKVNRLIRCLSSPDKKVRDVAWIQLSSVVRKRKGSNSITDKDLQEFINSAPSKGESRRGDVRSLWSAARKSLMNLGCEISIEGTEVKLTKGDTTVASGDRKAVRRLLNEARGSTRLEKVLKSSDQGRSFHLISRHPSSNHWIQNGAFVSFAEYRFAVRGRLNLLPTRTVVKRAGRPLIDTTCPKCKSHPQTLGHVLNACTPNAGLMRERHNAILKRLSKAIPDAEGDKFLEQKVKNVPGDLRPDIVLWHPDGKVTIADVTIPYEGDINSFEKARNEKKEKYQPIADWLKDHGHPDVTIDAFIVGSLGSWDTENEDLLRRLRIGTKYAGLFRKLCAVDAIKGSLAIWRTKG